eukprot:7905625-Lingulodinium_polyedra.AAC.1
MDSSNGNSLGTHLSYVYAGNLFNISLFPMQNCCLLHATVAIHTVSYCSAQSSWKRGLAWLATAHGVSC